jgi:sterol desaturase/sphingolipid hydroxylase (fatty acid hydroxylase superfamily)
VGTFFAQLLGYVALSTVLEYGWYHRRFKERRSWRTQPENDVRSLEASTAAGGYDWGLPARDLGGDIPRRGRNRLHARYATVNLVVSALFAGMTCEAYLRGWTHLKKTGDIFLFDVILGLVKLVFVQSVLEYYWHRAMHFPFFYKKLHKTHHHYKSPVVWDDLFIDPREAFGYYCILYGTGVAVTAPPVSFLAYMAVMGTCGVLDHCGIGFTFSKKYDVYATSFHDAHHAKFNANYAFPFAFMDVAHGTYLVSGGGKRNE